MKHVYPPRHPAEFNAARNGVPTSSRDGAKEPPLPHEQDESSRSQARGTAQQKDVGSQARDNATDGTTDTDRGPQMDQVYNEKVAPRRGPEKPRH
jgi:hypothetical protein